MLVSRAYKEKRATGCSPLLFWRETQNFKKGAGLGRPAKKQNKCFHHIMIIKKL
jgi:hypothetical protein